MSGRAETPFGETGMNPEVVAQVKQARADGQTPGFGTRGAEVQILSPRPLVFLVTSNPFFARRKCAVDKDVDSTGGYYR